MPGVTLTKWRRVWAERFREPLEIAEVSDADQLAAIRRGEVDMCFVRLPIDRAGMHAIPLYDEVMVAWVAKDHPIAAVDELTMADLADETVLSELDAVAIDRVLAGAVLVVPMSIARSASRRDLVHRPIIDADPSPIALAWLQDNQHPLIAEFVGVVRGRSVNSSRSDKERGQKQPPRKSAAKESRTSPAKSAGRRSNRASKNR